MTYDGQVAVGRDARRGPRGEDESGPAPGTVLSMSRANGGRVSSELRRRSHGTRSARRTRLPGVSFQAWPEDPRVLRRLPSASLELRARRRKDGYDVLFVQEQTQRPLRQVRGLPHQGRAAAKNCEAVRAEVSISTSSAVKGRNPRCANTEGISKKEVHSMKVTTWRGRWVVVIRIEVGNYVSGPRIRADKSG